MVIRAWRYIEGTPGHKDVPTDSIRTEIDPTDAVVWIDTLEPTPDQLTLLVDELGISSAILEALGTTEERTKLQHYGSACHVAVHDAELGPGGFVSREIDVVTGPGWVLTVRHSGAAARPFDTDLVAHRFELQRAQHKSTEEGFLLWALLDVVIDRYLDATDAVDDRLDDIEEVVFDGSATVSTPREAFSLRRDLMLLRRSAAPLREVINSLTRGEVDFITQDSVHHLYDIHDRLLRVLDLIESQRDLLTGLLEADLAVISNRLNQVMKKMTSWGAILIVATLIAGIYGMNFREMPELRWQFGYPMALGLMVLSTGGLYWWFKRHDWL